VSLQAQAPGSGFVTGPVIGMPAPDRRPDSAATPDPDPAWMVLQTLVLPEAGLLEDPVLFVRLSGGARIAGGVIHLPPGGQVVADGWMNLFALGLWQRTTYLDRLSLRLTGAGQVTAELIGLQAPDTDTIAATAGLVAAGRKAATAWDGRGRPPRAQMTRRAMPAPDVATAGGTALRWTPVPAIGVRLWCQDVMLGHPTGQDLVSDPVSHTISDTESRGGHNDTGLHPGVRPATPERQAFGGGWPGGAVVIGLAGLPAPRGAGLIALALRAGPQGARIDAAAFLAAAWPDGLRPAVSTVPPASPQSPAQAPALPQASAAPNAGASAGASLTSALPVATRPPVRLVIAITTFRREAALARTVMRICAFLDEAATTDGPHSPLAAAHLVVIDNGDTVNPAPHPRLTRIANRNLGGAGGFARALAAARGGGFTHCLFMDDDAAFPMENLRRTAAFLHLARSDRAAVAGAMISAARPTEIWENGALFDRFCRPLFNGADLTDPDQVAAMEEGAARPKPAGFYGGFWFFAFPVAAVRHDPFPFFVRGDDISFSLANRFDTVTLPGVVSVQDDFGAKESPQSLYLDLRNHLHHHLTQDGMDIGPWRSAGIALRFVMRSVVRMHYASAAAQCLAWADVLEGPTHFEDHADMAARRATLAALAAPEAWRDTPGLPPPAPARPPGRVWSRLMLATLNGHLLPFWRHLGARRAIALTQRALIWPLWGAAEATFVDAVGGRSYSVRHDKRQALAISRQLMALTWRWWRAYPRLVTASRAAYGPMTAPAAWQARFRGARPEAQDMVTGDGMRPGG